MNIARVGVVVLKLRNADFHTLIVVSDAGWILSNSAVSSRSATEEQLNWMIGRVSPIRCLSTEDVLANSYERRTAVTVIA